MRKAITISIILLISSLYIGCIPNSAVQHESVNIPNSHKEAENERDTDNGDDVNNTIDYAVYEEEYIVHKGDSTSFKVKYLQVSGLSNDEIKNKINHTLKNSIIEWIDLNCEWAELLQLDIQHKSPNYLSVHYIGEWESPSKNDLNVDYVQIGIIVDINTGERVLLNDMFDDIEKLKNELAGYRVENGISATIDAEEVDEIIHYASMSEKEYIEEISKSDPNAYTFIHSYLMKKPTVYLRDDKLVITRGRLIMGDVLLDIVQ